MASRTNGLQSERRSFSPASESDAKEKDETKQRRGADDDDEVDELRRRTRVDFFGDAQDGVLVVDDPLMEHELFEGQVHDDGGVWGVVEDHVVVTLGEVQVFLHADAVLVHAVSYTHLTLPTKRIV